MLELQNVSVSYGRQPVLHRVSLTAAPGQITTLIGINGCGKSTLLKAIVGMLPYQGQIRIDGVDRSELSVSQAACLLAYLPQGRSTPDLTVGRMVLHGRFPHLQYPRRYRALDYELADAAMRQMGILAWKHRPVAELSGGMRQKVFIAMALTQQAPVLLMDEPTAYLDVGQQVMFAETILALAESGKTLLLVLHDLPLAFKISDRLILLQNGTVAASGTPQELLQSHDMETVYGVKIQTVETALGMQYVYDWPFSSKR